MFALRIIGSLFLGGLAYLVMVLILSGVLRHYQVNWIACHLFYWVFLAASFTLLKRGTKRIDERFQGPVLVGGAALLGHGCGVAALQIATLFAKNGTEMVFGIIDGSGYFRWTATLTAVLIVSPFWPTGFLVGGSSYLLDLLSESQPAKS